MKKIKKNTSGSGLLSTISCFRRFRWIYQENYDNYKNRNGGIKLLLYVRIDNKNLRLLTIIWSPFWAELLEIRLFGTQQPCSPLSFAKLNFLVQMICWVGCPKIDKNARQKHWQLCQNRRFPLKGNRKIEGFPYLFKSFNFNPCFRCPRS